MTEHPSSQQPPWLARVQNDYDEIHHVPYQQHNDDEGNYGQETTQSPSIFIDCHRDLEPPLLQLGEAVPLGAVLENVETVQCFEVPAAERVEAPSFLPYNFAIPDRCFKCEKEIAPDSAAPPPRSDSSPPAPQPSSVPQTVVSAVAAAASLSPSTGAARRKKSGAGSAGQAPAGQARAAQHKSDMVATVVGSAAAQEYEEPRVEADENTRQGWDKIMQNVDTKDAKLQRNKWWWYLLAEKNRIAHATAGAGPDLEKARGADSHAKRPDTPQLPKRRGGPPTVAPASTASAGYDPLPLLTVEPVSPDASPSLTTMHEMESTGAESPQFPPLHELAIYSTSEDEKDGDYVDEGEEDDTEWQPKSKPKPQKRNTLGRRRSCDVVVVDTKIRGGSVPSHDDARDSSLAACSSPPKRRRVDYAPPRATAAGTSGDGEHTTRKLPPRSRLKGLIEWMKSTAEPHGPASRGGPG